MREVQKVQNPQARYKYKGYFTHPKNVHQNKAEKAKKIKKPVIHKSSTSFLTRNDLQEVVVLISSSRSSTTETFDAKIVLFLASQIFHTVTCQIRSLTFDMFLVTRQ
jgi:hypothetical protein